MAFLSMLAWFIAFIVWVGVFIIRRKLPVLIGWDGEHFVSNQLKLLGPEYKVLDNLMIRSEGRIGTTQIDHLVVSSYGIFVVETKSLDGRIYGYAHNKSWTQSLFHKHYSFYNPLYQNYGHIKAIEALLKPLYPTVPIRGFVAFPRAKRLEVRGTNAVGHARDIIREIQGYKTVVISDQDREVIYNLLESNNIKESKYRNLHNQKANDLRKSNGFT